MQGNPEVHFEQSQSQVLGIPQIVLRKASYGATIISMMASVYSGIQHGSIVRAAACSGAIALNVVSAMVQEKKDPLPEASLVGQAVSSLNKPTQNTLFFNKSWSTLLSMATVVSGILSNRLEEIARGASATAFSAVEAAALSDQDQREKKLQFASSTSEAVSIGEKQKGNWSAIPLDFLKSAVNNRWIAFSNTAFRIGMLTTEAMNHKDNGQIAAAVCITVALGCQIADHVITEGKIRKVEHEKLQR